MKPEIRVTKPHARNLFIGLAFLALAGALIGMPLFRSVAAQKGVSGGAPAGAPVKQIGDRSAARAILEDAIKSGIFENMSSAKQQQLLLQAGMKYEGGELKPFDYPSAPAAGQVKNQTERVSPGDNPLAPLSNPLVNNPTLDLTAQKTQSETTIILTGANTAVAGYNDSGSFLGGVNSFTGYSTTTDMGATWTDRGILPLLGQENFGDPVLARNATTGTVFFAALSGGSFGMNIYRSTDGGVTFSSVADGAPGAASSGTDKEWITVDNFAGAGNGNVYHVYRDFGAPNGIFFTRSTNDGVSFSAPILIASGAAGNVQGAWVFVGADHAVYAGFYDSQPTPDRIAIRKSTDQGLTFAAAVGVSNLVTNGTNGSLNIPAGYRSSAFPQFIGSPTNANLLFSIHPDITVAGGSDSNIFFQQSTDGGATWSANVRLNTDAGTNAQSQPAIAVTPDGTALSVTWQDSRNDPLNRKVQRFGVVGTISGTTVTFGPNFQVSQPDWTPVFGADPVVNTVYMGDYDTMAADNAFFYTTFVDCRLGDQDVRFAKIPKAGPGEILSVTAFTPNFLPVATDTCNDLFVTLTNNGTATATAVSLTLTTATPGVSLPVNSQSYGDIAVGASVTNVSPFQLSIDNTFVCGTPIVINWSASTGETGTFTINTQGLGYQTTTMTGQTIVPGTTDTGNHTDDGTTFISLPFTFNFYSQPFTGANVSSNGNLQFTSNNTSFSNVCPFPIATMNNLISPHWDDLRTDGAGKGIFTSTSGAAPNRIFNIEWRAEHFSTLGTFDFEIRLYETTGQIDFVYGTVSDGTNVNGSSATVGIQKGTGSGGASDFTSFSCNAAGLSPGLKVSFTPLTACPTGTGACVTSSPNPTIIPEVEPNDTPGTAQLLDLTAEPCAIVDAAINPAGDVDYFTFTGAPAGSRVWIETDTGGAQGPGATSRDTVIDLLAADGTTVIENDDDDGTGNGGDGTIESGLASMIGGRTLTAGGTYFIRVRAFSATAVVNPYKLFVVLTNVAPTAEVETNNTAATANPITTAGGEIGLRSGAIGAAGDVDYYSVVAEAGNIVYFNADADPERDGTGTDLVVEFRDPADILLLSVDSSITGSLTNPAAEGANFVISTSGTYFVKVRHFSASGTGTYHLMVSTCSGPVGAACSLTCPANITVSNDPNQCGAIVNYPPPTSTGTCGTITCSPPSGSFFPVGTTTVTCTSSGAAPIGGGAPSVETKAASTAGAQAGKVGSTGGAQAGKVGSSGGIISGVKPTTSNSAGGGSAKAPSSPVNPGVVLYDQNNNPAPVPGGVTSQNFEAAFDTFDTEAADDFVVPAGENWTVEQVFVVGEYNGGPAASVNVVFYSDSSMLPGAVVATRNAQTFVDVAGDFTVNLSPTVVLSPGTYWVGVQANQDFGTAGQWFWDNRSVISNSGAAWRNPGGGFGVGCTSFGRKTTCLPTQNGPDQLFQILGTSAPIAGGATCTFTITVVDTQPPTITCPPNITAVTDQNACPAPPCVVVNYPPPTATDNCPGVTVVCNPPAGSCFPTGVTTVTCTATDASGNTATCSFTVTTFDTRLQDDSDPSIVLLWNSLTGSYRFCCHGTVYTGVGKSTVQGCIYTLQDNPAAQRVLGRVDKAVHSGTASLQSPPGKTLCTITDRNTLNDTGTCP